MKVAIILEGNGDLSAFPTLVAKTGAMLGMQIFAPNPIVSGGVQRMRRPGELERFVRLASSRNDIDAVLIVLDLDDGCAADMHQEFYQRINAMPNKSNVEVRVCFCVREYETWFLEDLEGLKNRLPQYEWDPHYSCPDPSRIRGAKEYINRGMKKTYKVIGDQIPITRALDLRRLFQVSRSYRKFVRALTGFEYEVIELGLQL